MLKAKSITIRITLEEWQEIRDNAMKANLSMNDYVRKKLKLNVIKRVEVKKQKNDWNKKTYEPH